MNLQDNRWGDHLIFFQMTFQYNRRLILQTVIEQIQIVRCHIFYRDIADNRFDVVENIMLIGR